MVVVLEGQAVLGIVGEEADRERLFRRWLSAHCQMASKQGSIIEIAFVPKRNCEQYVVKAEREMMLERRVGSSGAASSSSRSSSRGQKRRREYRGITGKVVQINQRPAIFDGAPTCNWKYLDRALIDHWISLSVKP